MLQKIKIGIAILIVLGAFWTGTQVSAAHYVKILHERDQDLNDANKKIERLDNLAERRLIEKQKIIRSVQDKVKDYVREMPNSSPECDFSSDDISMFNKSLSAGKTK